MNASTAALYVSESGSPKVYSIISLDTDLTVRASLYTLTKCSFSDAIRPLGFLPDAIDAMVRLRFKECKEVPFVIVSIKPAD